MAFPLFVAAGVTGLGQLLDPKYSRERDEHLRATVNSGIARDGAEDYSANDPPVHYGGRTTSWGQAGYSLDQHHKDEVMETLAVKNLAGPHYRGMDPPPDMAGHRRPMFTYDRECAATQQTFSPQETAQMQMGSEYNHGLAHRSELERTAIGGMSQMNRTDLQLPSEQTIPIGAENGDGMIPRALPPTLEDMYSADHAKNANLDTRSTGGFNTNFGVHSKLLGPTKTHGPEDTLELGERGMTVGPSRHQLPASRKGFTPGKLVDKPCAAYTYAPASQSAQSTVRDYTDLNPVEHLVPNTQAPASTSQGAQSLLPFTATSEFHAGRGGYESRGVPLGSNMRMDRTRVGHNSNARSTAQSLFEATRGGVEGWCNGKPYNYSRSTLTHNVGGANTGPGQMSEPKRRAETCGYTLIGQNAQGKTRVGPARVRVLDKERYEVSNSRSAGPSVAMRANPVGAAGQYTKFRSNVEAPYTPHGGGVQGGRIENRGDIRTREGHVEAFAPHATVGLGDGRHMDTTEVPIRDDVMESVVVSGQGMLGSVPAIDLVEDTGYEALEMPSRAGVTKGSSARVDNTCLIASGLAEDESAKYVRDVPADAVNVRGGLGNLEVIDEKPLAYSRPVAIDRQFDTLLRIENECSDNVAGEKFKGMAVRDDFDIGLRSQTCFSIEEAARGMA